jgi:hypothetical protein
LRKTSGKPYLIGRRKMIYTFTDIFDNLEHAALKLLSPDDDVTNYMKVAYNFVTDGRYAQCNSSKVST